MNDVKEMNIYEKMSAITAEIRVNKKNLNVKVNSNSSYKAVSERDVLDAVKPIEQKYRVYSYPANRKIVDCDVLTKETEYNQYFNSRISWQKRQLAQFLCVVYQFRNVHFLSLLQLNPFSRFQNNFKKVSLILAKIQAAGLEYVA